MTFGQFITSSPGWRRSVTVRRQIADTLTTGIRDRAYADTGRLPGEVELSARFAVNRPTLRQAMAAPVAQLNGTAPLAPGQPFQRIADVALSA